MGRISENFKYRVTPLCNENSVVKGEMYRFTVLTPSLIRMEYNEKGIFEDRATKVVTNRNFPVPKFTVKYEGSLLKIRTERLELFYHTDKPFDEASLTARMCGDYGDNTSTWRFKNTYPTYGGAPRNYFGTTRNLDSRVGPVALEDGLMSSDYTDWDDSKSPILCEDGWVDERPDGIEDTYLFAYREHHLDCLRDFLSLSGKIPMLPRYALGNWWSRYHRYTADEYKEVIENFFKRNIPLSIGVLDVDWHITDIEKRYGRGWTGYTFNKELFPNPEEFLYWMHQHGLKVTVNLHDRENISPVEENYLPFAKEMGVDYENGDMIEFNFCSPKYIESYFKFTHYDNEKKGVDFWWIDGFPENRGPILKADIPWMLNHYHYIDSMKNGKRGMLLSRYCGVGGHRYGVEFSGDTNSTWEMLDFLPYFTANASNVGCGWWSHDVGGFMCGTGDEEMYIRWEQLSVFSPINRVHSSDNPFMSREPWKYTETTEKILTKYMRLRHELIPYIYTMNYHCYRDNITLIRPLYYYERVREFKNEYYFGDTFLVTPITTKIDSVTKMAHTAMFMPHGIWFDYFSSRKYIGDRYYNIYRGMEDIPAFVRAGSIIPQTVLSEGNGIENPKHLKIDVFPLDNGEFSMYEDDGITLNYEDGSCVVTDMELTWGEKPIFKIKKPVGDLELIPQKRDYTIKFRNITNNDVSVISGGVSVDFETEVDCTGLTVKVKNVNDELTVKFNSDVIIKENDYVKDMDAFIMRSQIGNIEKWKLSQILHKTDTPAAAIAELCNDVYDNNFKNAAIEIMTCGME